MAISTKIQGFMNQSSWIRKMFEEGDNLKKQYGQENVFDFSLGNPNVAPPPRFKELLRQVVDDEIPNKHGNLCKPDHSYHHKILLIRFFC